MILTLAGQSERLSHMCNWKISGVFNGIQTHDLCDAGAVLLPAELWSHSDVSRSICWARVPVKGNISFTTVHLCNLFMGATWPLSTHLIPNCCASLYLAPVIWQPLLQIIGKLLSMFEDRIFFSCNTLCSFWSFIWNKPNSSKLIICVWPVCTLTYYSYSITI